jgi:hypothetical protein
VNWEVKFNTLVNGKVGKSEVHLYLAEKLIFVDQANMLKEKERLRVSCRIFEKLKENGSSGDRCEPRLFLSARRTTLSAAVPPASPARRGWPWPVSPSTSICPRV